MDRGKTGATGRVFSAVALAAALASAGCDGSEDSPNNHEKTMAVDPRAAMDTTPAGTPAPPSIPTIGDDLERSVGVRLADREIDIARDTVPAGEILFQVMNTGAVRHALAVTGPGLREETPPIDPGGLGTLTLRLEPGTYALYCPIVDEHDHAGRGMRMELVVSSD